MAAPALSVMDVYPDDRELFSALITRFWANVDERGEEQCWPWKGSRVRAGYGRTKVLLEGGRETSLYSHRLAYLFCCGDIPEGAVIRHSCDNPPCCNPAHLLSGTHADNSAEMVARGRCGRAKLDWKRVRELRARREKGERVASLAQSFGVSESAVRAACAGRTWRNERTTA